MPWSTSTQRASLRRTVRSEPRRIHGGAAQIQMGETGQYASSTALADREPRSGCGRGNRSSGAQTGVATLGPRRRRAWPRIHAVTGILACLQRNLAIEAIDLAKGV